MDYRQQRPSITSPLNGEPVPFVVSLSNHHLRQAPIDNSKTNAGWNDLRVVTAAAHCGPGASECQLSREGMLSLGFAVHQPDSTRW